MVSVRAFEDHDFEQWLPLWAGNNQGHIDEAVTAETWNRLLTSIYPVHGFGAFENHEMVGLLHYILHPVTGHIDPVCYMQDVYTDPDHRRKGVARALIEQLTRTGRLEQWARIYWLAEADNEAAQALYKTIGVRLNFSLHVLPL